jgi:hypothetical protein
MIKTMSRKARGVCIFLLFIANMVCFVLSFVTDIQQDILTALIIAFMLCTMVLTSSAEDKP